jgi:ribosomal protein S14
MIAERRPESGQLSLLCDCGRRRIELPALGLCRLCYQRHYHSWRWFGGLRESVLARDRRRCRACGVARGLIVHHRTGENAEAALITLCLTCHVRLHRTRALRHWLPQTLFELWRELNPEAALQYQLPLTKQPGAVEQKRRREPIHATHSELFAMVRVK